MIDPADGLPRADEIRADGLRLTPLAPADADALFPVLDDERLHAFTGGRPDTLEELRARLRAWSSERSPDGRQAWLNWLVRSTDDGRILGTTQATVERAPAGLVAVLAWTTATAEQGRGVASEAAAAMAAVARRVGRGPHRGAHPPGASGVGRRRPARGARPDRRAGRRRDGVAPLGRVTGRRGIIV